MLCDEYKEALIEAAASGTALPTALREHMDACVDCAAIVAGERALFAAVDAGLHKAANAEVRCSFLTNVKANLASETVPNRNPIPGWVLVCATATLGLAVVFLSVPRGAHDKADTGTTAVANRVPAGAGEVELSHAPGHRVRLSARDAAAKERQDVTGTASYEPDVLIQPEEEEFLKRFYAAMRNPVSEAKVVVTDNHEVTLKSLVIEQIEVSDLKIENLDAESGLAQTGTK